MVPDVKMMMRVLPSAVASALAGVHTSRSVIGGCFVKWVTSKVVSVGTSLASRTSDSLDVSASKRRSLLLVICTLYRIFSAVSACQLIVTGVVPHSTDASRKARSPTVLHEKECVWHSPGPTLASFSTRHAFNASVRNWPRV